MKFILVAPDHEYESAMVSGGVNGGTVWLDNIAQALRWHGHEAELASITENHLEADYVIVQSEFIHFSGVTEFVATGGKVLCLLGHFNSDHPEYPTMQTVRALSRHILTPWEGDVLDGFYTLLMPHAYNDLVDENINWNWRGNIVFVGNSYPLRNEDWFKSLDIHRVYGVHPKELPAIYRAANVCVNIHGDFQKNLLAQKGNRISNKPGMMINERFWNILGSGGLMVCDWVPQMGRWFTQDELIIAHSQEEFYDLVSYYNIHKEEGLVRLAGAFEKVRKMHTYKDRVRDMFHYIC